MLSLLYVLYKDSVCRRHKGGFEEAVRHHLLDEAQGLKRVAVL